MGASAGISAFLSGISLLGFLIVILGVVVVVISMARGGSARGGIALSSVGLILFVIFNLFSQGVIVVQPTETAVVFQTISGELLEPRQPGTSIIIPILQEAVIYPTNRQEYTMSGLVDEGQVEGNDAVRSRTNDGQEVSMDITMLYYIDSQQVNTLHRNWYSVAEGRPTYEANFIRPTSRGVIRDITARYTATEIYGEDRAELRDAMQSALEERFLMEGIVLTDLLLRDVTFSEQFTQAIEQARVAEQDALREEIRVRQTQQEAERVRVAAQGQRDATITEAQGEAEAIVLRAQAEAEALRLVSEQIAANPSLIQYLYVQNLSDNVSISLVPTNSPFLFDFDSLAQANASFTAPSVPQAEATPSN